jgi:hypothetical protein
MNVTDRRRDHLEAARLEEAPQQPSSSTASTATTGAPRRTEASLHEAIDRLPVSADYGAFVARLPAANGASATAPTARGPVQVDVSRTSLVSPTLGNARDAAVQQRLDAFRDRFSGPYDVAGAKVTAQPMFRMNTPTAFNARKMEMHAAELTQICAKAGIPGAAAPARFGRCSPEQLVKVTQALIDAGKLPAADQAHPTLADRIRGMQWEWGIGVDCAGYTQQAAAAAHGDAGSIFKANLNGDIFSGMMKDTRFASVQIANIRPGDVIHLDSPTLGEVGHNVICRTHTTLDDAARATLLASKTTGDAGKAFLAGAGPFHAFEVDSSWGAGEGSMVGGFRRDTWIYSESSLSWASYPSGNRELPLVDFPMSGPQGELFGGAFRPRAAQ